MRTQTSLIAAALLVAGLAGCGQPPGIGGASGATQVDDVVVVPRTDDDIRFVEAVRLYRDGRYSAAYGQFMQLADRGHLQSSRIALRMLRHGRAMYNTEWSAAPSQVATWENTVGATVPMHVVVLGE
ncbi:MAG: hypothetical protein JWQ13_4485 [Ramlibacter sp.]|jgi:hypothetical protein|nr:hypothetical protein [Ramlibacter sp.]